MPSLTKRVAIPSGINTGLTSASSSLMLSLLGNPRSNYSQDCQPVTNARLKAHIKTKHVGPFRATGFDLALESLIAVMADIRAEQPSVFAALSSAGMLCCRFKRGSSSSISNHAWGTAIDLKLDGILDAYGDGKVQFGLTLIAPIFNRHKWFWGATFPKEDGMHFEVSTERCAPGRPRANSFRAVPRLMMPTSCWANARSA
ncbi:MAG: M15 family metallopeptidase [Rhizobiales bacterium]|nr:M15 family metallopeptidase [Hyphomicrobiales bacterium]